MFARLISIFTSLRLTVVCLLMAIVLVFAGTLAQVKLGLYVTQEEYFRSPFVFWTPSESNWKIPVWPGGWLLGGLLLLNLIAAHLKRFKFKWTKSGIFLIHFGLIALLVGQLFTELFQVESFMVIPNGGSKNFSEDGRKHELAVVDITDPAEDKVVAIPESALLAKGEIKDSQLPFAIRVKDFFVNSVPALPATKNEGKRITTAHGFAQQISLVESPPTAKMNDENKPSALVEVVTEAGSLGDWGVSSWLTKHGQKDQLREFLRGVQKGQGIPVASLVDQPQQFTHAGRTYVISLRPVRYYKPYSIDLIKFTHARYKGTDIPKDFSSRIRLRNRQTNEDREILIYMNNPLRYGGETYFQGGFLENDSGTILQVVRNPAWLTPYFACVVVGLGLAIQFSISFSAFLRKRSRNRTSPAAKQAKETSTALRPATKGEGIVARNLSWIFVAVFFAWIVASTRPPTNPKEFKLDAFGRLPALANGRIQPIDSFARNTLLSIHGSQSVRPSPNDLSQDRTLLAREWLLEVMANPEQADKRRIFRLENLDLRNLLGAREGRLGQIAYSEILLKINELTKEAQRILSLEEETGREPQLRNGYEKDLMHLYQSLILYKRLKNAIQPEETHDFEGELKLFRETIPLARAAIQESLAGDPNISKTKESVRLLSMFMGRYQEMTRWGHPMLAPPQEPKTDRDGWSGLGTNLLLAIRSNEFHPAIDYFAAMAASWRTNQPARFNKAIADYENWLSQHGLGPEIVKARREFLFNHIEPFYKATIIYVAALLLGCAYWINFSSCLRKSAYGLVILAFTLHTAGLLARMALEGRPPVTNLYSSAVFVGWGAVLLGIILEQIYSEGIGIVSSGCIGFITLIIAHNLALGGDTMEMMRAVLDTNVWLATHVVIINIGYAATALAGLLGIVYVARGFFTRNLSAPVSDGLVRMAYGIVCFATLFTFVGTVLGGLWADQSWGRFWGWDPKENGALLIVLANATLLDARWGGLIRNRGLMAFAIFGNIVTAWSWFGTNMLGVGLHSYGFMDKGFRWLLLFIASQVIFIVLALIPFRCWRSFKEPRANRLAGTVSA